ncbi:uncharacterized protein LOC118199392 isoform X2 [Stegodyphus dumicola]|nr:uncharacterized protein LOC118199392 isoform X2 [Stegodyphus dumicola]XP_035227131.1 uncharacterized protein LOC118199392 isoform X2 [Stegodyphus dumicola]
MRQEETRQKCLKIVAKDTEAVLNSVSFMHSNFETALCIFQLRDMNISSEAYLLRAAIEWLQRNDYNQNSVERERLLSAIEIMCLQRDEFLEVVKTFPSFFSDCEITSIILNILNCNARELPNFCKIKNIKRRTANSEFKPYTPEFNENTTQTTICTTENTAQTSVLTRERGTQSSFPASKNDSQTSTHARDTTSQTTKLEKQISRQTANRTRKASTQTLSFASESATQTTDLKFAANHEVDVKIDCTPNQVIINCTKEEFTFKFGLYKRRTEEEIATHFCLQQESSSCVQEDNEMLTRCESYIVEIEGMSHLIGYMKQGLKDVTTSSYDSSETGKLICEARASEFQEYYMDWVKKVSYSRDNTFEVIFPALSINKSVLDRKWEALVSQHLHTFLHSDLFKSTPPEFVLHALKQKLLPLSSEAELLEGIIIWLSEPSNISFRDVLLNEVAVTSLTLGEFDYICEKYPDFFSEMERRGLKNHIQYGDMNVPCWCETSRKSNKMLSVFEQWAKCLSSDQHDMNLIRCCDKVNLDKCHQISQAEVTLRYEPFSINTRLRFRYFNSLAVIKLGFGTDYSQDFRIELFSKTKDFPKKMLGFKLYSTSTNFCLVLFNLLEATSDKNVILDIHFKASSREKLFAIAQWNGYHPYITIKDDKIPCFRKGGEWRFIISELVFFPRCFLLRNDNDM